MAMFFKTSRGDNANEDSQSPKNLPKQSETANGPTAPAETSTPSVGYAGYLSDLESEESESKDVEAEEEEPPRKRRRVLEVPARVAKQAEKEARHKAHRNELSQALTDIRWMIKSKRMKFEAGNCGLQAYRAHTIQSYLTMVIENGRSAMDALSIAAEAHGFSSKWGARLVRIWVRNWIKKRDLPESKRGCHVKFLRSNKWSMNPEMLATFTKQEMVPSEAKKYLEHIVEDEMPRGLKNYLEVELFPRIHMKVDEMTAQTNDGPKYSWVYKGEQPLLKKGVGRGLHQSNVICSTVGWLEEASQTLEYGKNYEGYWNGELFVKQLKEKIIPVFERIHGPGYQAVIIVDNSQGHGAYSADALRTANMNFKPGGKQARMRDGWFLKDGQRITQSMIFPTDHTAHPNETEGMKAYLRDHCDYTFDTLKANMHTALKSVDIKLIRKWEHRVFRWMDAYRNGMDAKNASIQVKAYSSCKFTSHRRIPESVAKFFD
ncbi:hypothetical protein DFH05DRAFT_1537831 [Lentinula detonsa]|uniref:DDE-1 domain-containing protein n=1 Tax=Lentinula detonsa TaxID=2804962 RepID=A0A9W8NSE1_9AGAR|nr:hypothetical protein DFH05DRAFT_1537831 [Lentinula detonsa]